VVNDILFVIPTVEEHLLLFPEFRDQPDNGVVNTITISTNNRIRTLVTGPGPFLTTYHLGRHLYEHQYDLIVQLGICGTHDPGSEICSIVHVTNDQFYDFGAEDHSDFIDAMTLGFYDREPLLRLNKLGSCLDAHHLELISNTRKAKGITVFTATGSAITAEMIFEKYGPVMETMEGAAFYYCCNKEGMKCVQIRAVSNIAGPRDRDSWKIKESLIELRKYFDNTFNN
jgi:futalosine hydrolase